MSRCSVRPVTWQGHSVPSGRIEVAVSITFSNEKGAGYADAPVMHPCPLVISP